MFAHAAIKHFEMCGYFLPRCTSVLYVCRSEYTSTSDKIYGFQYVIRLHQNEI